MSDSPTLAEKTTGKASQNPASKGVMVKLLRKLDLGERINPDWVVRQIPFVILLVGLAVLHIINNHMAEEKVREISNMEMELKQLRWEHMTTQSQMMFQSKQSEVARQVEPMGLKELSNPPIKIEVKSGEYK